VGVLFIQAKSKFSQIQPNPAKLRQALPKIIKGNPWISFAELSLFKELRGPPRPSFFLRPLPAPKARERRRRCLLVPGCASFVLFSFRGPPVT
jgi:hypothetical protein